MNRPKPLLLLCYLALEGHKERRFLQDLFWPSSRDAAGSLRATIYQLHRDLGAEVVRCDGCMVWTELACDARELLAAASAGETKKVLTLHQGPFLEGVRLHRVCNELKEWVVSTREKLARRVRAAHLEHAERLAGEGRRLDAAREAEAAILLTSEPPLETDEITRLYPLLERGGSGLAAELKFEAAELELELPEVEGPKFPLAIPWEAEEEAAPGVSGWLERNSSLVFLLLVVSLLVVGEAFFSFSWLRSNPNSVLADPSWRTEWEVAMALPGGGARLLALNFPVGVGVSDSSVVFKGTGGRLELSSPAGWPLAVPADGGDWARVRRWEAYSLPVAGGCPLLGVALGFEIMNDFGDVGLLLVGLEHGPRRLLPLRAEGSVEGLDGLLRPGENAWGVLVPRPSLGSVTLIGAGGTCTVMFGER